MSNYHHYHAVPQRIRVLSDYLDIDRARRKYKLERVVITSQHSIGQGSRGDVYKGQWDGTQVAIKVMRGIPGDALVIQKRLIRELLIWSRLDHENVAAFYGLTFDSPGSVPGIVTTFIDYSLMEYTSHLPLTRPRIIYEIARGFKYLHERLIIHGDLKPDNVRVSGSGRAKIIDFGMGKIESVRGFTTDWSPNPRYAAPELVMIRNGERVRPTFQSDVYSFAMLMLQVLHGRDRNLLTNWDSSVPFNQFNENSRYKIYTALERGRTPSQHRYRNITAAQWSFLDRCWNRNPSERPSFGVIVTNVMPPPTTIHQTP